MGWLFSTYFISSFSTIVLLVWYYDDERRSSLVEKDVDSDGLNPKVLESLVPTERILSKNNRLSLNYDETERATRMPVNCTNMSESKYCTTEEPFDDKKLSIKRFSHPRNVRGISVLTAQNRKSYWMSHKPDKYLTELAFLNPFSYDKSYMIHLGIYIATLYPYGDHVVYKMSPISPFGATSLKQEDRLMKINGFDVTCWSHATLANFFLHLPHNDQNRFMNEDNITKFNVSIEFLRKRRSLGDPDQRPDLVVSSIQFIMNENGRISVGSTTVNPVSVTYLNRTTCSLLKLGSSPNRYVKIEEVNVNGGSWTSSGGGAVLRVIEGERLLGERNADITFHEFDVSPRNEPGKIVAMEAFREGVFLHAGNSTAGTSLSLMSEAESSSLQNITSRSESRLFRVFSSEGNILSKIVHIQSGLYLKAENGVVSLAQSPVTNSMMFRIFQC